MHKIVCRAKIVDMDVPNLVNNLGSNDHERAKRLGVDRSTASRLRRGKTLPSYETTLRLLALQDATVIRRKERNK